MIVTRGRQPAATATATASSGFGMAPMLSASMYSTRRPRTSNSNIGAGAEISIGESMMHQGASLVSIVAGDHYFGSTSLVIHRDVVLSISDLWFGAR